MAPISKLRICITLPLRCPVTINPLITGGSVQGINTPVVTATAPIFIAAYHPLMKQTPAVKHQRYLKLQYAELTPGPANIKAAEKLAHAMYPAANQ